MGSLTNASNHCRRPPFSSSSSFFSPVNRRESLAVCVFGSVPCRNEIASYDINHERGRYVALRDVLTNIAKSPFSFLASKAKKVAGLEKKEEFWALQDINFTVEKGEVLGIIGSNGAGKSTLLKILSQITPPTTGEIVLRGRVGSLLEVGTGFHPELTGRENVFLNGAILGMKRNEIARKFDEIVEFAGIEKFLDTPVKYYSSGMYVRLAFSVAAHMDPDILIVDEVLAVGDAEFQKKCLGKMEEVTKKQGRTIIFVSHNMGVIQQLCSQTVVLQNGKFSFVGDTKKAIEHYTENQKKQSHIDLKEPGNRKGNGAIKLTGFHIENKNGLQTRTIENDSQATLVFEYECPNPTNLKNVDIGFSLERNMGLVSVIYSSYTKTEFPTLKLSGDIRFTTPNLPLAPGLYNIGLRILVNGLEADRPMESVGSFEVLPSDKYNKNGYRADPRSVVLIDGQWSQG